MFDVLKSNYREPKSSRSAILLSIILCILFSFHWHLGRSRIDWIIITYFYPIVLGIIAVWISAFFRSKMIWWIPFCLIVIKQLLMCIIYGFQAGFFQLYSGMAPAFLLSVSLINIAVIYFIFVAGRILMKIRT